MLTVVLCDRIDKEALEALSDKFLLKDLSDNSKQEMLTKIGDADCVIVRSRTKVDAEFLNHAPRLKLIGRAGVGLDNIDTETAERRGIKILNTPDAPTTSVAELVMGLMINLMRGIGEGDRAIRRGAWLKNELLGTEILGKTLGVIGYGRIGSQVGRLASCMGMRVIGWDILGVKVVQPPAEYVEVDALLREADVVSLHVPLTQQTKEFFNSEKIDKMKQNAFLINASRGEVLDENALYEALVRKRIAGAALDVFEKEPYTGPLASLENVILTPHIGANTREAQKRSALQLVELVTRHLLG
jgi:D-3-phosphoglycerate dehydrogenase